MNSRIVVVLVLGFAINICAASYAMAAEPAITTYGERSPQAPDKLDLFSFLVGKWNGTGRTRLADGSYVQYGGVTWIGRYVLNGTAIADEIHGPGPDDKPYLGITFRHFDTNHDSWIVGFLNVTLSFVRRQVNPQSGFVSHNAGSIAVISEDAQTEFRKTYRVLDQGHFTYTADMSTDGPVLFEMTMTRVE